MSELVQRHEFLPAPKTAQEAMQLAHTLAESKLIPKAFQHEPNDVFVAMMWSANLGVPALQGIQGIAVINGKPSIYGDLGLAVCMSSGLVEGFKEEYFESKEKAKLRDGKDSLFNNSYCRCTIKRKGINEPFVKEFSVQDALTAGLWNKPGPWVQYPKRMLQMRARSYALRDAFPDLLMGMSFVEETQDIVDVTEDGEVTSVTSAPKKMPVRKPKPSKVVEEPKKEAPEEPKEQESEVALTEATVTEAAKPAVANTSVPSSMSASTTYTTQHNYDYSYDNNSSLEVSAIPEVPETTYAPVESNEVANTEGTEVTYNPEDELENFQVGETNGQTFFEYDEPSQETEFEESSEPQTSDDTGATEVAEENQDSIDSSVSEETNTENNDNTNGNTANEEEYIVTQMPDSNHVIIEYEEVVEETPVEETQPEQELTNEEMADAIVNDMAENPENYSEEEVFVYTK